MKHRILFVGLTFVAFTKFGYAQHIGQSSTQYNGNIYHMGGKIGIGIINPVKTLEVATSEALGEFRLRPKDGPYQDYRLDIKAQAADEGALTMSFKDNVFLKSYGYYYLTGLSFGVTGYTDLLHLKNNGNVGIGTTEPSSIFHVRKDVANNIGPTILLQNNQYESNSTNAGSSIRFTGAIPGRFIEIKGIMGGWALPEKISFSLNGLADDNCVGEAMVINRNGNVGIGTSNPGIYKLAVEGIIGAREVKVTTDSWADFVFKPNYNLRPLSEVEQFIKANNHLPEIPSEAEVKENGIGLGEMNAKLLQKVEELTLYLIEQNKEIIEMKKENEKQRIENDSLKKRVEILEAK